MFFLGVSANLMIYLLVPAFLSVLFFCKGLSGNPGVHEQLPDRVIYACPSRTSAAENGCVYEVRQQKARPEPRIQPPVAFPTAQPLPVVCDVFFRQLSLYIPHPLRAPPFFS